MDFLFLERLLLLASGSLERLPEDYYPSGSALLIGNWRVFLHLGLVFRSSGRVNQHLHMKTVQNRASSSSLVLACLRCSCNADSSPQECFVPDRDVMRQRITGTQ